jgi:hypothetical protein
MVAIGLVADAKHIGGGDFQGFLDFAAEWEGLVGLKGYLEVAYDEVAFAAQCAPRMV